MLTSLNIFPLLLLLAMIYVPDMLISTSCNTLYVIELSVGFETNLKNNANGKFTKYRYLLNDLSSKYRQVKFVNLSISSLRIFGQSCDSFIQMCNDLTTNTGHTNFIITKLTSIIIRTTYYICAADPGLTRNFFLSNSFLSSISLFIYIICLYFFSFFIICN